MPESAVAPVRKRKPKTWIDRGNHFRAEALALLDANRGNVNKTATECGISEATLRYWRDVLDAQDAELRALHEAKQGELGDALEDMAWTALAQAKRGMPSASAKDAMICAGISVSRMADLRGLPQRPAGHADGPLRDYTPEQLRVLADALERAARLQADTVTAPNLAGGDSGLSPAADGAQSHINVRECGDSQASPERTAAGDMALSLRTRPPEAPPSDTPPSPATPHP